MVTIAVPRAWAFSTLRQRSWMSHVLIAGTWHRDAALQVPPRQMGGIPLAMPRSSSSGLRRATSAHGQGDLRITVRASPSSMSLRASHSSSTSHRLVFPDELAGSSDRAGPSISFGAPADDRMSIAASGDELGSGEDDSAALPPSGRVALPESDPDLTAMLSRAAESIGEGRAYQYKALPFWLSLSPRVFTKVVEAALVTLREAGIRILNYLNDWLILAQSRALLCEHRDMVLSHLSRLGLQVNREKSKLSPTQRISFLGMELDSVNLTARLNRACSVNAELPGVFPAQEGGSTETLSEAPGAYGIRSRCHAARIASYETASALASRPGPEMGMAPRHVPGLSYPILPPHLQPMVGPCFSSGRSSPSASIQACCCINRCLYHWLGGHVQRACSCGALVRAPAAVAYQLPRVAGSMACSALL